MVPTMVSFRGSISRFRPAIYTLSEFVWRLPGTIREPSEGAINTIHGVHARAAENHADPRLPCGAAVSGGASMILLWVKPGGPCGVGGLRFQDHKSQAFG